VVEQYVLSFRAHARQKRANIVKIIDIQNYFIHTGGLSAASHPVSAGITSGKNLSVAECLTVLFDYSVFTS